MACNYDKEAFKRSCPVIVKGESWNYWVLYRTLRDKANEDEIIDSAKAVLSKWLDEDLIRNVEIVVGTPDSLPDYSEFGGGSKRLVVNRAQCSVLPTLNTAGNGYVPVYVKFYSDSVGNYQIAWPTYRQLAMLDFDRHCPFQTDWMLESVIESEPATNPGGKTLNEDSSLVSLRDITDGAENLRAKINKEINEAFDTISKSFSPYRALIGIGVGLGAILLIARWTK